MSDWGSSNAFPAVFPFFPKLPQISYIYFENVPLTDDNERGQISMRNIKSLLGKTSVAYSTWFLKS